MRISRGVARSFRYSKQQLMRERRHGWDTRKRMHRSSCGYEYVLYIWCLLILSYA